MYLCIPIQSHTDPTTNGTMYSIAIVLTALSKHWNKSILKLYQQLSNLWIWLDRRLCYCIPVGPAVPLLLYKLIAFIVTKMLRDASTLPPPAVLWWNSLASIMMVLLLKDHASEMLSSDNYVQYHTICKNTNSNIFKMNGFYGVPCKKLPMPQCWWRQRDKDRVNPR